MKFLALTAIAAALVSRASAHTLLYTVSVDGTDMGSSSIRVASSNSPVKDLTSPNLRCNDRGETPVSGWLQVQPGQQLTSWWEHATPKDDIIDPSHKGGRSAWLSGACSNGDGDAWVKFHQDAYSNGEWATDRLRDNQGNWTVTVPNISPGHYIARFEIQAFHEADVTYVENPQRGIQLYMGCIQLEVIGSGTESLPTGVALPGYYTYDSPGITFNLYDGSDPNTYKPPGPDPVNL